MIASLGNQFFVSLSFNKNLPPCLGWFIINANQFYIIVHMHVFLYFNKEILKTILLNENEAQKNLY